MDHKFVDFLGLRVGKQGYNAHRHKHYKTKKPVVMMTAGFLMWALRDSNPRPSACKADALNQLS